jgi:hypothetical protein
MKDLNMKTTIVELGSASKLTRDYSGNSSWDSLTFSFKRFRIGW